MGSLHGIRISRASPPISHHLFADDVMIFARVKVGEASVILKCLDSYAAWSGQRINPSKSAVFFSRNCRSEVKVAINNILHLAPIPARAKYLGIPLFFNRKKKDTFSDLKERIFAKLAGWKAHLLSQAARTTLIKSVANAIPSYVMSLFLLPKTFCAEINSGLKNFWWGFPLEKKKNLSLLSWSSICQPKAFGGLGIRSMGSSNNSLLARLGWKMTTNAPFFGWMF